MSVNRLIEKLASEAQQHIALMVFRARLDLKELAERNNRSRGQINRWIRKRAKA